jgi:proteasome lid subunit RPN8/RPN11
MSDSRINVSPSFPNKPRRAHIPFNNARHWRTPFENEDQANVTVFVTPKAYVRFCTHAGSDLDNEVGGWLLGKWRIDPQTEEQFVVVESVLPARYTRFGSAFLTFTQDSQVWMVNQLQELHQNRDLLGWYHTHPHMGVFLSQYDTWLHQNFFPASYQIALVIEPHSLSGGFFIRNPLGELDAHRYYGFYELNNGRKRSVVHWQNLLPEDDQITIQKGELS